MSLNILLSTTTIREPVGEFVSSYNGTFIVPDRVFEICVVMIGRGGAHATHMIGDTAIPVGGGGAGLSWRNNIPVEPGQVLTYTFASNYGLCTLYRNTELLVVVQSGENGSSTGGNTRVALGGKNLNSVNDGGGNGGFGGINRGGGAAGGYTGNGPEGGQSAKRGQGGSGGNGIFTSINGVRTLGNGGGTHIYGVGENGYGGTLSNLNGGLGSYGDGKTTSANYGGGGNGRPVIRIMWGGGRFFPDNARKL